MTLSSHSSTRSGRRLASEGSSLAGDGFFGGGFGAGDDAQQRFVQLRGLDRLGQATGEGDAGKGRVVGADAHGGQQHQRQHRRAGQLADFAGEHQAVHVRASACRGWRGQKFRPGAAIRAPAAPLWARARNHAPFAGLQGEDAAVGGVVIHDQQAQIGELRLRALQRNGGGAAPGWKGMVK